MLFPSSGTGQFAVNSYKVIRFARQGCTNRPFFHIVVAESNKDQHDPVIEQLGVYDPLPNERNEKLVSLNLERIQYWIGKGADCSKPIRQLLGLSGFYPVHPSSYIAAWRARKVAEEATLKTEESSKEQPSESQPSTN